MSAAPVTPYPPTSQVVLEAWLAQRVDGLDASMVGANLPKDPKAWATAGFLQARTIVGGTPLVDIPLRRPVFQLDAWAAKAGSNRPPWGTANRLVELVRIATEADAALYGRPVTLPTGYGPARVQAVYLLTEPRQINNDPSGYARFTMSIACDWLRA